MPLNKLDNFLKNVEGRILYVSPSDLDASDAMSNQGNSQTTPFKTIQRALIEAARFSYVPGNNNDITEKTTILLMPGEHLIDNRPGYKVKNNGGNLQVLTRANGVVTEDQIKLNLESNFDLNQEDNILRKFNSINGGVIVPRGTSIVGLDLRKTKVRPKYIPNPTDSDVASSAIFRITGACYFWQFSIFDGKLSEKVYTDPDNFDAVNFVKPSFSHHKLTCFEYADGVNKDANTDLTDLNMYYYKLSIAYGPATGDRNISEKFPSSTEGFVSKRPEFEIVGAFASDPLTISAIESGESGVASPLITVTTEEDHGLDIGTPIRIKGVSDSNYNVSTTVSGIVPSNSKVFRYTLDAFDRTIVTNPSVDGAQVIVETDTVNGASPYIFNISLRSVFGMNGMHADGAKATGFRSMVVAQFTGVSLQKDDRAFVKYDKVSRKFNSLSQLKVTGGELSGQSSAASSDEVYHLDSNAIYRSGWETRHVNISNDAILQIVSVFAIGYNTHFEAKSGADASITNSNSNFGQLALVSDGFKKDAFAKDDRAFITHIIPPKAITTENENIDWVSIDQEENAADTSSKRLYLFGFTSEDSKPPSLTQGFRIGAKTDDKLFVIIDGITREAKILMDDGTTTPSSSGVKELTCTQSGGLFEVGVNHSLNTGEKIIIISDTGDLPENIEEKTVYFVDKVNNTSFRVASTKSNAENGQFISAYDDGANLKVFSRVTDKNSGDVGHPIQFDSTKSKWYINVDPTGNTISSNLSNAAERTEPSFVIRNSDIRNLDDRLYKLRFTIPKEIDNSKNPENGFVIQESSSTGVTASTDFTRTTDLTRKDFLLDRNPRFISSCTFSGDTIQVTAEKPHNLNVGDLIKVRNIKDAGAGGSSTGEFNKGYNGEFTVDAIENSLTFKYKTTKSGLGAVASNNFNDKTSADSVNYPRFEKTDLKSNIYIFRNTILSEYIKDTQDGIYQSFLLNASNYIPLEYNSLNYSQNVVDLYPQLDRDNVNENPQSSRTFASRQPLGKVTTSDPLKSITRETIDKLLPNIGVGASISFFTDNTTTGIVSFTREHNLAGIVTANIGDGGGSNSYVNGTHFNVKVFNSTTQNDASWNGTLAKVVVSGAEVTSVEITNAGSGWQVGNKGYFDTSIIAGGNNNFLTGNIAGAGLTVGNIGISSDLVIQTTGIGVTSDGYFRITSVNDKKKVTIAKSSADTTNGILPQVGQYGFLVSPTSKISSKAFSGGIQTVVTDSPHGLVAGNRFQLNNASNLNQGSFIVKEKVSVTSFTFEVSSDTAVANGYIIKHGLSANDAVSEKGNENLSARGVELFDVENGKLGLAMGITDLTMTIDPTNTHNILQRFPYKGYLLIDDEIVRVSKSTASGGSKNVLTVIRGVFGTLTSAHVTGSLVKRIKPFPIQFNRPSILRASGHTFEYLGYGPGNYSTALPQVQLKTISEKEEFLSQSQERGAGAVVYTGMNNKGDFYIGNQKKSSLTGEETTFDTPIPSVAGEEPGGLSVVFDEVTIKERLVVEGGKSNTSLSEFDGPVTFNNETQFKNSVRVKTSTDSTSPNSGALVISGGVGFAKTANFADNAALKFGNDGDLAIVHEPNQNVIRSTSTQGFNIQGENRIIISNINAASESAVFNIGAGVTLKHSNSTKFETLGVGATVTGTMFATNFSGSGADLTDINDSTLFDSNNVARVQAVNSGVIITGITTSNANINVLNGTNLSQLTGDGGLELQRSDGNNGPYIDFKRDGGDGDARIQMIVTGGGTGATDGELIFRVPTSGNLGSATVEERFRVRRGGAKVTGALEVTGDITALTSDIRLKHEISPIAKALEKVNSLSGFTYKHNEIAKLKCDIDTGDQTYAGVSAQDVQKVLPEAVKPAPSNNDYLTVQYEKLVPLLIEAVKELSAKVDALENQINN